MPRLSVAGSSHAHREGPVPEHHFTSTSVTRMPVPHAEGEPSRHDFEKGGQAKMLNATEEVDPVTRMDSVRAATGSAMESVQHAAEAVAPYAGTAKEQAAQYAHEARVRLAPTMSKATQQARSQYSAHVAPLVPPKVDDVAHRAVVTTRKAARQAADYAAPRVELVKATAGPVAEEAAVRSAAALAALRGGVTAKDVQKLV